MKILLIISSFNTLSQAVYCKLKEFDNEVKIIYSISKEYMITQTKLINPDLIFCPFLKEYLPEEIFENYSSFILHPGPIGDRGHNSIDFALNENKKQWGAVILKASKELDAGDIYAYKNFELKQKPKASIYRNEVVEVCMDILEEFLQNYKDKSFTPMKQILNPIHETISQEKRKIDWTKDTSDQIIKKINMSDSYPGVKENILGVNCFIYGAKNEYQLKGKPKEVLAKRDGAICLGTIDGSIWISHIKQEGKFKLPATYVLKDKIKGISENRLPLVYEEEYETYHEISAKRVGEVIYLYFDFYNGAMSSSQAIQLKYAIDYLKEECKVLVLMGGEDFFCNGIHLNILEDSKKQGEDGWSNINAINDLVKSVIFSDEILTVASFEKNAGAGGVFLGLACDKVISSKNAILNPHYKTLGLSGSEYHTYNLYRKTKKEQAHKLLNDCLPINANRAKDLNLIDEIIKENYFESLNNYCQNLVEDEEEYERLLDEKKDRLFEDEQLIEKCKEKELEIMYDEFWDENSSFHTLRKEFIYKTKTNKTPKRLKDL